VNKTAEKIIANARETILKEAEAIEKLSGYIDDSFADIVEAIAQGKGRVVVTGIGKSANIGTKIVSTLNSTGTPAMFMHAADAIHGDLGMICPNDIVLCISKSGNTPEIKVLLPLVTRLGNTLVGMVSDANSYLAQHSDYIIRATVDHEACPNNLAPTNSTTAQLVMGDALAVCLLKYRDFSREDFAKFHPGGSLGKKIYMRVKDLYTRSGAPKVYADTPVKDVIIEISSKRLGATAVVAEGDVLLGIITDGDLRRMLEKFTDFSALTAKDIMSSAPQTISEDERAIKAFNLMEDRCITQLLVAEERGKYLGVVHLHDILKEGIM